MNAITKRPLSAPELPASAQFPILPLPLERQMWALAEPSRYGGDQPFALAAPEPRYDPAAAEFLPDFEALCGTPSPGAVLGWFTRLGLAVANAPPEAEFRAKVALMAEVLVDLPACVWTAQTCAEACRTMRFWPTPAEVDALLRPRAATAWRRRDALRRIADAPVAAPVAPVSAPTDTEREAVSRQVDALVAELRGRADGHREAQTANPRYLSDGVLLARYEAMGEMGRLRAQMLRGKLGLRTSDPG